jgi:hypothetical protein
MDVELGKWMRHVPKTFVENVKYRRNILKIARRSPSERKALRLACAQDPLFYINVFCWTFNPRLKRNKNLPFVSYPFQDRCLKAMYSAILDGHDLAMRKSRDMGASWMSLYAMEQLWHFHPGFTFLILSREADAVDKPGSSDALFWKVDFMHRLQPDWLKPQIKRRKQSFVNEDTGNSMDGEASTSDAAVGGRRSAIFLDEFSRMPNGMDILGGTADCANCRIFNYTQWEKGGATQLVTDMAKKGQMKEVVMHWTDHPEKMRGAYQFKKELGRVEAIDESFEFPVDYHFIMDGKIRSPWYDAECVRRGHNKQDIARNIDMDEVGASYGFFDAEMISYIVDRDARDPYFRGDLMKDQDCRATGVFKSEPAPLSLWCHLDADGNPPKAKYAVACDISWGQNASNSVASVVNGFTGEKVAMYCTNNVDPKEFARRSMALADMFKDYGGGGALLCWEQQGPGTVFAKEVLEVGYSNIYRKIDDYSGRESPTPGWFASVDAKNQMLSTYRAHISSGEFTNRSKEALMECLEFVTTKTGAVEHAAVKGQADPTGSGKNHGDMVIADALADMMADVLNLRSEKAREGNVEIKIGSMAWRSQLWEQKQREMQEW